MTLIYITRQKAVYTDPGFSVWATHVTKSSKCSIFFLILRLSAVLENDLRTGLSQLSPAYAL